MTGEELAIAGGIGVAGFTARWMFERFWKKKDSATTDETSLHHRMIAVEVRETERAKHLGQLETNVNRLDGKVDGLQNFWRTEFAKLTEQFHEFEGKVEFRLDTLRAELRGDQQKTEERMTNLLTQYTQREAAERAAHQQRMHDRINVMSEGQAKLINELIDMMADRVGEPRPSPRVG